MKKKKMKGPAFCPLCGTEEEKIDHLLLSCNFSISIWQKIAQKIKVSQLSSSIDDL